MKLRVKASSGGGAWRIEIENNATISDLKNAIVQQCFGGGAADDVTLSMNKRAPLAGEPDATLSSCGVRNGDLLWILGPSQPSEAPPPAKRSAPTPPDSTAPKAPLETALNSKHGSAEQTTIKVGPSTSAAAQNTQQGPSAMDTNGPPPPAENEGDRDEGDPEGVDPWRFPVLRVPCHLMRVLCSNSDAAATPSGVLLLTAHAALLETGFSACGTDEDPNKLPSGAALAGCGVHSISYHLPGQQQQDEGSSAVELKNGVKLTCSAMGQSMLLVVATPDGHVRHLQLEEQQWVGRALPGEQNLSGVTPECRHVAVADGHRVVVHGLWGMDPDALRTLWNTIKDKLALPMAVFSGLAHPANLLTLPTEVKDGVLRLLGALDLAALGCTCSEMRHLTASDDLWRPLLAADFPSPPLRYADQAGARGCKWVYAQCHKDRRRREEEAARARRRRFAPAVPHFGPRPPFYPVHAPPGFPGIIGGDQDRFPFLGGTGSTGFGGLGWGGGPSSRRQQGRSSASGGGPSWF